MSIFVDPFLHIFIFQFVSEVVDLFGHRIVSCQLQQVCITGEQVGFQQSELTSKSIFLDNVLQVAGAIDNSEPAVKKKTVQLFDKKRSLEEGKTADF